MLSLQLLRMQELKKAMRKTIYLWQSIILTSRSCLLSACNSVLFLLIGGIPDSVHLTKSCVVSFSIVGFTAWASSKEAPQVFELLETVYNAFDDIATVSLPLSWILCFKNTLTSLLHCVIGTKSLQGRDSRRLLRCCRWHPESPTTSCSCHV